MKAFLMAMLALVVITVVANQALLRIGDFSSAEVSKSDRSVRLGD
ncbi:hypothetical protein ACFSUD_07675 [Sulfitobacter aestuarii]|uniref:Uncharacterized protein n=1 Tax=Sulfitobacter aestuarii TaxID=2161676 RepID=A0ABW5U2A7_9RHOB